MLPHTHFLAGLLVGLIGYSYNIINLWQIFLIAFLTTLLDIDHLILYFRHHKSWNPVKCWNAGVNNKEKLQSITHNYKFAFIITLFFIIITYFNLTLGFILLSIYTIHIGLDFACQLFIETKRIGFKLGNFEFKIHLVELLIDIILATALLLFL